MFCTSGVASPIAFRSRLAILASASPAIEACISSSAILFLACDSVSESEIVIPLHKDGRIFGVLDIDSPVKNQFSDEDKAGLESFSKILEEGITLL